MFNREILKELIAFAVILSTSSVLLSVCVFFGWLFS
jgi:hypothetical protein